MSASHGSAEWYEERHNLGKHDGREWEYAEVGRDGAPQCALCALTVHPDMGPPMGPDPDAPHDHLANVEWSNPTWSDGPVPLCARCGLVLEVAGDALVVPFDTCACGHPRDGHQTGKGPWTGFCGDPDCKCEEPHPDDEYHAGELTADEVEEGGHDAGLRDHDGVPWRRLDYLILTMPARELVSLSLREGVDFLDEPWPEFGAFYVLETAGE